MGEELLVHLPRLLRGHVPLHPAAALYAFASAFDLDIERLSTKESKHAKTVMELTGWDYRPLAVCFAVLMYIIVFLVELFAPWRQDVAESAPMTLSSRAWSPVVGSARSASPRSWRASSSASCSCRSTD